MGRPKKENKPVQKILSWRVDATVFDLFDKVHNKGGKKTKVDTIEYLIRKEAKRLGVSLSQPPQA